jgi:phosphonate transport system permease protein
VLAIVLGLAYRGSEGNVAALFSSGSRQALADFLGGFWPPEHSAAFLKLMARPLLETVGIAFLGITLALILALPLSILAVRPGALVASSDRATALRRAAYLGSRLILNLMRSIPELIWALIFVRAVGIGAAAVVSGRRPDASA